MHEGCRKAYRFFRGFQLTWPSDWAKTLGVLARVFKFQPSEMWVMTKADLEFWMARAKEQLDG